MISNIINNIEIFPETEELLREISFETTRTIEMMNEFDEEYLQSEYNNLTRQNLEASFEIESYEESFTKYIVEVMTKIKPVRHFNSSYFNKKNLTLKDLSSLQERLMVYSKNDKVAGKIRDGMVYIGTPYEIIFTPPEPDKVKPLMMELLKYINKPSEKLISHPFIKGAIAHYLTVFIHPFYDGNGRTSRILQESIMARDFEPSLVNNNYFPFINLSKGFLKNRSEYYRIENKLADNIYDNQYWNEWFVFNLKLIEDFLYEFSFSLEENMGAYNVLKLKMDKYK